MLNLGIIGKVEDLEPFVREIQKNSVINIIGKSSVGTNTQINSFQYSIPEFNRIELIERSDVILIDNSYHSPFNLLSSILKKSKHLFISGYPSLTTDETMRLIKLANEAGVVVQVKNPLQYLKGIQWMSENLTMPAYFDIMFFREGNSDFETEYFPLHLMMKELTGLSPKKIEAVSYSVPDNNRIFINVRLEHSDASVVNFAIGNSWHEEKFMVKAYTSGKFVEYDVHAGKISLNGEEINTEDQKLYNEFDVFINTIMNRSRLKSSLEDYQIVQHSCNKIAKKLGLVTV